MSRWQTYLFFFRMDVGLSLLTLALAILNFVTENYKTAAFCLFSAVFCGVVAFHFYREYRKLSN
jgi:hypothetical protein